jgi:hypothetical protein
MFFRIPQLVPYIFGLCLIAALGAAVYFAVPAAANAIGVLAAGLFIGHFIGSLISGSDSKAVSPAPVQATAKQTTTAGKSVINGETKTLYVGNIAFRAPRSALQELFESHGRVHSVRLMTDRNTRKPKGYGFVEMDGDAAESALAALDGNSFFGRDLRVSVAKQQELPNQQ